MKLGGLEAGGTKMVCAIGDEYGKITDTYVIPTKEPKDTIPLLFDYFKSNNVEALGIGSFGPIDLNKNSKTYGYITTTPKKGWSNFDMVGAFKALDVPIGFDTDVNGSALGEHTYGKGQGVDNLVYITVGTGIGAGIISEGRLLHGMFHPEAGHMLLKRHKDDMDFESFCPYHDNCLEGLAAGPAIEKRWNKKAYDIPVNHKAWEIESYYLAQALVNMTLILGTQRFILGGGVMHQLNLFPMIREEFKKQLNGYIVTKEIEDLENFIIPQSLDDKQGILGAIKLGLQSKE